MQLIIALISILLVTSAYAQQPQPNLETYIKALQAQREAGFDEIARLQGIIASQDINAKWVLDNWVAKSKK